MKGHAPPPEGERRGTIVFSHKSLPVAVDLDVDELAEELLRFHLSGAPYLRLVEPIHGNSFWLSRAALERIDMIGNGYVDNGPGDAVTAPPAPRLMAILDGE